MSALPVSFGAAIQRSLPGPERLAATAEVFDDGGPHSLALTGTSLRVIDFATEPRFRLRPHLVVPLGFGGWVVWMMLDLGHLVVAIVAAVITLVVCRLVGTVDVAVPTVNHMTTVPLSAISSAGTRTGPAGVEIDVRFAGGVWNFVTSDPKALHDLIGRLDVIRAGRMMASYTAEVADTLSRLTDLLRTGAISPEEYEAAKHGLLNVKPTVADDVVPRLRSLHELHRAGGLTASEWRMAKWDLLATMTRTS